MSFTSKTTRFVGDFYGVTFRKYVASECPLKEKVRVQEWDKRWSEMPECILPECKGDKDGKSKTDGKK